MRGKSVMNTLNIVRNVKVYEECERPLKCLIMARFIERLVSHESLFRYQMKKNLDKC